MWLTHGFSESNCLQGLDVQFADIEDQRGITVLHIEFGALAITR